MVGFFHAESHWSSGSGAYKSIGVTYSDDNALFSLTAYENKPVTLRLWLEGTDEACTDAIRKAEYSVRLRFVGTDENGNLLEGKPN